MHLANIRMSWMRKEDRLEGKTDQDMPIVTKEEFVVLCLSRDKAMEMDYCVLGDTLYFRYRDEWTSNILSDKYWLLGIEYI